MRLFHVSEESDIEVFHPRLPKRKDLDPNVGLVWAINENCLPNFLTPRDCPRVTYHVGENTVPADIRAHISSGTARHVVVIESAWFERMKNTTLFIYEFDSKGFVLQDFQAGYYVSTASRVPVAKRVVSDLFAELFLRNVELRVVDNLWDLCGRIQKTSLNWSMCRMVNAIAKSNKAE